MHKSLHRKGLGLEVRECNYGYKVKIFHVKDLVSGCPYSSIFIVNIAVLIMLTIPQGVNRGMEWKGGDCAGLRNAWESKLRNGKVKVKSIGWMIVIYTYIHTYIHVHIRYSGSINLNLFEAEQDICRVEPWNPFSLWLKEGNVIDLGINRRRRRRSDRTTWIDTEWQRGENIRNECTGKKWSQETVEIHGYRERQRQRQRGWCWMTMTMNGGTVRNRQNEKGSKPGRYEGVSRHSQSERAWTFALASLQPSHQQWLLFLF